MFLFHGVHPKKISVPALVLTLLFSALAVNLRVNLVEAQYFKDFGWVSPKPTTIPPTITISSPQNNTIHTSSVLRIALNVVPPSGPTVSFCNVVEVYYLTSWQQDKVYVFKDQPHGLETAFSDTFELRGVPQGLNSITVTAIYYATYIPYAGEDYHTIAQFMISGSSTVTFAVDLFPLRIGIQSPYPQAYATSDVALTFTTNEKTSQLQYSLDDEAPVTITGNATLAGLTSGNHNLTVYGVDKFGNPGTSEIREFTVEVPAFEPFADTLLVAAVVVVAVVCAILLVYFIKFKKRRAT
jgi:hypothetical protein